MCTGLVQSNRRAIVAETVEKVADPERQVSEHKVYHSLLCILLHSLKLVRVPMLTLFTIKSTNTERMSIRAGPRCNGRRWPDVINHAFFYITWIKASRRRQCDALGNVLCRLISHNKATRQKQF